MIYFAFLFFLSSNNNKKRTLLRVTSIAGWKNHHDNGKGRVAHDRHIKGV
jgi:hypothetical protein